MISFQITPSRKNITVGKGKKDNDYIYILFMNFKTVYYEFATLI